jgi:hypothetical protein
VYFGGANKTFTMSENAIISDNTSDSNGGGVFLTVVNSTFIMESGNITENKAQYGGGVYIFTGSFTINNGNITANNAGFCGGGVYKKAGEFNQGMGYITDNDAPFKPNYGTAEDISGVTATTWTDLANLINDTSKPSILFIGGLLKANSLINIDRDITLLSDIYSISRNGGYTGSFFTVASNKTLSLGRPNLQSNKLTLDGVTSGTDSATGALITVNGTLVMHDGVTLQDNNRSSGDGGGIYVSNGGTFNMLGGKISNCSAERGGGVNVNYGTFTMSGSALITENTSNGSGGGVWAGDSGFTLSENATISNNSTTGSGGGVFFGGGDFTMNGGIIGGNTADSPAGGGGVYIASGSFAKTGNSIIYGNDASDENKNRVLNGTGAELNGNVGHAVYYNVNPAKYRNITAGPAFDMGTNPLTGWD